ncbi:MAG: hypothetical protein ACR2MA_04320 [Egibacteraceae bacterium]
MIHQCPRCELRYSSESEMKSHLVDDHHVNADELESFHYRPAHEQKPLYDARDDSLREE